MNAHAHRCPEAKLTGTEPSAEFFYTSRAVLLAGFRRLLGSKRYLG